MIKKQIRLEDFQGRWAIRREIRDNLSNQQGKFVGIAEFSVMDDGLLYIEQGKLALGDAAEVNAERCYHWRGSEAEIEVLFEDGRPFHRFNLRRTMPDARHLCGADMYNVTYDFGDWPNWSARWDVLGPRKDYRMISRYKRTV